MTFTSTDCSMAWIVDITCFNLGIGRPSTGVSATSSALLTAGRASEWVGVRELSLSGTDGTAGELGRHLKSRFIIFISRSNEKFERPYSVYHLWHESTT